MAQNKNATTKAPSKCVIANLLKASVAISICAIFAACSGSGGTNSEVPSKVSDADIEVVDIGDLPKCNGKNEGKTAYVQEWGAIFVCDGNGSWNSFKDDDVSVQINSSSNNKARSSSSHKSIADTVVKIAPETGDSINLSDTTIRMVPLRGWRRKARTCKDLLTDSFRLTARRLNPRVILSAISSTTARDRTPSVT